MIDYNEVKTMMNILSYLYYGRVEHSIFNHSISYNSLY